MRPILFFLFLCYLPIYSFSETQRPGTQVDGTEAARDLLVITTMLPGEYNNANQSYFDGRLKRKARHDSFHTKVSRVEDSNDGAVRFLATMQVSRGTENHTVNQLWSFHEDPSGFGVLMQTNTVNDALEPVNKDKTCTLRWTRDAGQFSALATKRCQSHKLESAALSENQLWLGFDEKSHGVIKMHQARLFHCYADIPGVGGGRDEPYTHYEGFEIHDMGGQAWFTSNEGRELKVSLFTVDWPMNNDIGIFTRDSLVVYVSERVDGEVKELSYAFTEADATRIGINLKWMLVSCAMEPNSKTTPSM